MARPEARRSLFNFRRSNSSADLQAPPPGGNVPLPPFWKAMIITSFAINLILILVLLGAGIFLLRGRVPGTTMGVQEFARGNITELQDVVVQLQEAHIRTTIPLDQPLPVNLIVPINQSTLVTTTADVPLSVPAAIDMGPFGQLYPNVNLNLPAGTPLLIQLKLDVPLQTTIPVKLNVPVDIAMKDTELAPQFRRLGEIVDNLVGPAAPLLGIPPSDQEPQQP